MTELHERIAEAHGGLDRWGRVERVLATASLGGSEFLYHLQPRPLEQADVSVDLRLCRVTVSPFPTAGRSGVFEPSRVFTQDDQGQCLEERAAPGLVARSLRHWFVWDSLDVLYVVGLTLWHAVAAPFLACRSGTERKLLEPSDTVDGPRQRLRIRLPGDLPLPAREQMLHADPRGLLRRMDYSPVAYGGALRLGHLLEDHQACDGLVVATRQVMYPCLPNGQIWRLTRLAWINLDDVAVLDREPVAVSNRA